MVIASPGGTIGGGGTGSVTREISEWLRLHGRGTRVVVLDTRGVGRKLFWPFYFMLAVLRLFALRLTSRPEILHVQVTERGSFLRKGMLLRLGRALGMRCILHHHGAELVSYFRAASRPVQRWFAATARKADLNIVLGRTIERFLVEEVAIAPGRVVVLPNAVRDFGSRPPQRSAWTAPAHYLLVANLSPRKGVSEFLKAIKLLQTEERHVQATLVGGDEVARYMREAAALGLASCTFTGWIGRQAVEALLKEADALVLPSYDEGLPMAILEALSAGLPVVATPVGSIPEVLTDGKDCLLVPPGDVDALASAMKLIADDHDLRECLTHHGRALYEERFQIGAYMQKLISLYEETLRAPEGAIFPQSR